MSGAARLIAVGDNCLDVYLTKGHMAVGGNALNVAVGWRQQGIAARYFGVVGDDPEAGVVLDALGPAGLARGDVERRAGHTAVTLLLERNGDRRFLLEDLGVGADYVPEAMRHDALRRADWVHLGTNAAPELVRMLVRDGARFSLDLSTAHDALAIAGVPLVFASGPEDPAAPVEPILQGLRARGAARAVVTCGARGAFLDDGSRIHRVRARSVPVVDTTGAGDSFIATFLAATVLHGAAPEAALQAATDAAARTCTHPGGFPQPLLPIPDWLLIKYAGVIAGAEA